MSEIILKQQDRLTREGACGRHVLLGLSVGCILIVYVISALRIHPANFFGLTEDDSIYFSSAKALADGKGYILPSVPGMPTGTKYPIFYPWILSRVWRSNPSFPGNLATAIRLNIAFGCVFVVVTFIFLTQFKSLSNLEALLLTLFCALHPTILLFSGCLLSDIPFAALILAAIVCANGALQREHGMGLAGGSGILAGLAILTRVMGIPIAAGILATSLVRRAWRKAAVFTACAFPFVVGLAKRAISVPPIAVTDHTLCSAAWHETYIFYTSYVEHWKLTVAHTGVFWQMLKQNAVLLLLQPGSYFVNPHFTRQITLGIVLAVLLSAATLAGILRLTRGEGYGAIYFALALYVVPILLWMYPLAERFLLPFIPLFAAGLWTEGKNLVTRIRRSLDTFPRGTNEWAASFLMVAVIALGVFIGSSYIKNGRFTMLQSRLRGSLLSEKLEAYAWLKQKTPTDAKVIAYEDATLFLYSDRQAMRPVILSPAAVFDPSLLDSRLSCIGENARAIQASYWVISDDDFSIEWDEAVREARKREDEIERVLPLVFRSTGGHVRIYELDCEHSVEAGLEKPNGSLATLPPTSPTCAQL